MPPVRKKLPNTLLDNARVRPRTPAKISSMHASEAFTEGQPPNFPDKGLTDSEPVRSAKIGPEANIPIELAPEAITSRKGKVVVREKMTKHAETSARKFAEPASKGTASTSVPEYPPELRSVMEAVKRRTTQITRRLTICSTATSSIEAALSPLSIGKYKEFVDGIKVYPQATIGQFVQSGPESTPLALPARPSNPLPPRTQGIRVPNPSKTQAPAQKITWANIARAGLGHSTRPSITMAARPAPKAKRANTRTAADTQLVLRLAHDHPHRLLSLAGVRSAVAEVLGTAANDITLVQQVKTGFALNAKDELARNELLDSSATHRESGIILEPVSNLVGIQIATVPVTIHTLSCSIAITAKMVADEVTRVTKSVPFLVRPHGTCKPGAPNQN